jgi:hypothetical protein
MRNFRPSETFRLNQVDV